MMVLLKDSAHGHGSGHPSEPPNSTYMLPNGHWCCRAGVVLGIGHSSEKTCEQEGEEDPQDAKTPNRADLVDAFGCSNSRVLHLWRIKSASSQEAATNRVTTPRWENDADRVRSKMSKELTYRMSARDRETGAHDALVHTTRIMGPPLCPPLDKPRRVMPRFALDGNGVGRVYALYMLTQSSPSWTSNTLH